MNYKSLTSMSMSGEMFINNFETSCFKQCYIYVISILSEVF